MKTKKRTKVSRMRGSHTHGGGFKKKGRGKGHRGGVGMSGTGKRADQKKTKIIKKGTKYFGKSKTLRAGIRKDIPTFSLTTMKNNINSLVRKKIAKKTGDSYELDLKKYKVIGNIDLEFKAKIHALSASKGATEAVKKSGGEIVIEKKESKKAVKKA